MPIDTSMYSNLKPMQAPDMMEAQQKAQSLSGQRLQQQYTQQKMDHESEEAAHNAHLRKAAAFGEELDGFVTQDGKVKAEMYPKWRETMIAKGLGSEKDLPPSYDPGWERQVYTRRMQTKDGMEKKLAQLTLAQKQADVDKAPLERRKLEAEAKHREALAGLRGGGSRAGGTGHTAEIRAASSLFKDPNIAKETNKLNAARGVQSLVEAIRNKEIVGSKNVAKQLTNMIATIEMGTPGGVADREAMGVDTLYTRAKGLLGYLESSPTDVIPDEYLAQLEHEGNALGDRAAMNYKAMTDSILAGADESEFTPDRNPGRIYSLAKQRRETFMKQNGYDPESGGRIGGNKHGGGHGSGGGHFEADVLKYAKDYGMTPEQAQALKNRRSAGK